MRADGLRWMRQPTSVCRTCAPVHGRKQAHPLCCPPRSLWTSLGRGREPHAPSPGQRRRGRALVGRSAWSRANVRAGSAERPLPPEAAARRSIGRIRARRSVAWIRAVSAAPPLFTNAAARPARIPAGARPPRSEQASWRAEWWRPLDTESGSVKRRPPRPLCSAPDLVVVAGSSLVIEQELCRLGRTFRCVASQFGSDRAQPG